MHNQQIAGTKIVSGRPTREAAINPETGQRYPWAMDRGEDTVYAETATALLAHIIPGYIGESLPDPFSTGEDDLSAAEFEAEENLFKRYENALLAATVAQTGVYDTALRDGVFDPSQASEEVLTALLSSRTEPLVDIKEWTEEIPLVLIATDYVPFTTIPAPKGNIAWIDPSTEDRYLRSLAKVGIAHVVSDVEG